MNSCALAGVSWGQPCAGLLLLSRSASGTTLFRFLAARVSMLFRARARSSSIVVLPLDAVWEDGDAIGYGATRRDVACQDCPGARHGEELGLSVAGGVIVGVGRCRRPQAGKHHAQNGRRAPPPAFTIAWLVAQARARAEGHSRRPSLPEQAALRYHWSGLYLCRSCCSENSTALRWDLTHAPQQSSLDHFVGTRERCAGNGKAKRLGGLQVDDKMDFRCLLDWKIGRPGTLKYHIHIRGGTPVEIRV
jgi:hypothetical protein